MKRALTKIKILLIILAMVVSFVGSAYARTFFYFDELPGLINAPCNDRPICVGGSASGDVEIKNLSVNTGEASIVVDDILIDVDEDVVRIDYILDPEEGFNIGTVDMRFSFDGDNIIESVAILDDGDGNGETRSMNITLPATGGALGIVDLRISAVSERIEEGYKDVRIIVSNCGGAPINSVDAASQLLNITPQIISCDENDNYLITTKEQLLHLSYYQGDATIGSRILGGSYRLMNDIAFNNDFIVTETYTDATGIPESPVQNTTYPFLRDIIFAWNDTEAGSTEDWDGDGSADGTGAYGWIPLRFSGDFDGQGYAISNLYINRNSNIQGFFGSVLDAEINDLGIVDNYISSTARSGLSTTARDAGGLAGRASFSIITSCYTTGAVIGDEYTGGLVGYADSSTISSSYATGAVNGDRYVGGLVGGASWGMITSSYATGAVNGTRYSVGGLVGRDERSTITSSYATGAVSGAGSYVGGLVGNTYSSTITSSYATGAVSGVTSGGLVGAFYSSITIISSYAINSSLTAIGNDAVFDTSNYCSYGFDAGCNPLNIRSGQAGGIAWSDNIWEDLRAVDNKPKLEWETDGDVTTLVPWPEGTNTTACESTDDPFEGFDKAGDVYLIANENQLLCLSQIQTYYPDVLSQDYRLTADIDFSSFTNRAEETKGITYTLTGSAISNLSNDVDWDGDGTAGDTEGWLPLNNYTGTFDGNGKTITNLYINRSSSTNQGLFGRATGATISDLGLVNNYVSGEGYVGGLVGASGSSTTITSSYATGVVSGTNQVGGLVGRAYSSATITSSYATGDVSGSGDYVGGLVGWTRSNTISSSYATGAVSGGRYVGGLVGDAWSSTTITSCYATGAVSGSSDVGGLVGYYSTSTITSCYARGSVTGTTLIGGLVGKVYSSTITSSYATGTVNGSSLVGGLVGSFHYFSGTTAINNSYATGVVTGTSYYGGLVGGRSSTSNGTGVLTINSNAVDGTTDNERCGSYTESPYYVSYPYYLAPVHNNTTVCSDENSMIINGEWDTDVWNGVGTDATPTLIGVGGQ